MPLTARIMPLPLSQKVVARRNKLRPTQASTAMAGMTLCLRAKQRFFNRFFARPIATNLTVSLNPFILILSILIN